ncbi:hypothetical protein L226DRAFT_613058 [Lentinus tigrinus ALCF2SS1-7]|uniref:uncharacterized protein n=1 Tax=Lentinus tigrinus ALCF2SS1-7 TaxID=1328758 RepID=UPI00116601C7|nr:hypothetical protein L226DRAFT_613058 [Lentinus tigrinus ALCF2SS1-7]
MPAAAALLERILAEGYAPGMLRAANTVVVELDSRPVVRAVVPQRFAIPRPEKPKGHYRRILEWREEVEEVTLAHESGFEQGNYEDLGCGEHVQRALSQSRVMASVLEVASGGPANDVPKWPPSPRTVFEAFEQAIFEMETEYLRGFVQPSRRTPSPEGEVPVGFFIGRDGLEWPLPPRECMASPIEDFLDSVRPGLQCNKTSSLAVAPPTTEKTGNEYMVREPTIRRHGIKWPRPPCECMTSGALSMVNISPPTLHGTALSAPAPASPASASPALASPTSRNYDSGACPKARPGFFIGRGGLEWPLPPAECIDPAILETYRDLSATEPSPSPKVKPGFFIGRGGLEWPLPPPECVDPAVLEAHRASPAPTYSVAASAYRSADASEVHDSPSSTTSSATDSTLLATPQCGPLELAELRGLPFVEIRGGSPAATYRDFALGFPEKPVTLHECPSPRGDLGDAYNPGANWSPPVEDGFFRGSDGTLWPLPPTPPRDERLVQGMSRKEEQERRGRSPTPKWSMLEG